jgi:hypothetical protein
MEQMYFFSFLFKFFFFVTSFFIIINLCFLIAGIPRGNAGNGASIRAAPIGLFSFDNEQNLITWAQQQAFVTHQVLFPFHLLSLPLILYGLFTTLNDRTKDARLVVSLSRERLLSV